MARLGYMLKAKREKLGLSLRDFADLCDVSHAYIKNIEDGDPRTGKDIAPSIYSLEKLAPVLEMTVEDLLKEIGYIQSTNNSFEPENLKLIRGAKSYEEIAADISSDTGEKVEPSVFEALENGDDKNPSALFVDVLAKYADVNRSFFYRKNTADVLEYTKRSAPYQYISPKDDFPAYVKEELKEFIANSGSEEYLRLAKELCDKNIKVKFIRNMLFKE